MRSIAETTPTDSELCSLKGLPIAATGVPTTTVGGAPERHRRQCMGARIDPDDGDVAEQVPADDLGRDTVAVPELDVEPVRSADRPTAGLGHVGDHVRVRQDRALRVDDEPRALGLAVGAEVGVERDDAGRPAGVDRGRIEAVADRGHGDGRRRRRRWSRPRRPRWSCRRPSARSGRRARARLRRRGSRRRRRRRRPGGARGHCSRAPAVSPAGRGRDRFHVETVRAAQPRGERREAAAAPSRPAARAERRRSRPARDRDGAAHPACELVRDRKPEPAAGRLAAFDAVEPLEDAVEMLGRNPGAVVLDGEDDPAAALARPAARPSFPQGCGRARSPPGPGRSAGRAPRRRAPRRRRRRRPRAYGPRRRRGRRRSSATTVTTSARLDLLVLDPDPARVHPGEVEQVGGELRQPLDLAPRRREELPPGRLVEILVGEELEEAREGEQRRPELVGGVGDELLPGAVELGELEPHPVERAQPAGRPRRAPSSTTGSSKAPSAIRSAARCRRPSRRAWSAATANPSTTAISRATTVA